MLERIKKIHGVGLFESSNAGASRKLDPLTLVYGENGRGKSTLTSILAACSTGDGGSVQERKTLGGAITQHVELQFGSGHPVTFSGTSWSERRAEICVYDAHFVEQNVHSGLEVGSDQRKNLLSFALGSRAVVAKQEERDATTKVSEATDRVTRLEAELTRFVPAGLGARQFRELGEQSDVEQKIAEVQRKINAVDRIEQIRDRPRPVDLEPGSIDLDSLLALLNETLVNVHAGAESAVLKHSAAHGGLDGLDWIRAGAAFEDEKSCPYCGQDVGASALLSMYQTYFDAAYQSLRSRVASAISGVDVLRTQEAEEQRIAERCDLSLAHLAVWQDDITVQTFPETAPGAAALAWGSLRKRLVDLLAAKATDLAAVSVTPAERDELRRLLRDYQREVAAINAVVAKNCGLIDEFVQNLDDADGVQLRTDRNSLEAVRVRFSAGVVDIVGRLAAAEADLAAAHTARDGARTHLQTIMNSTLSAYGVEINKHLRALGAEFQVKGFASNYQGGTPRSTYTVEVRKHKIGITGKASRFATTLSEGDKRTMGFAFFAASVLADPDLSSKVIVVDDPMSSLDRSRRRSTVNLLVQIGLRAEQLVVLAHDPVFLRDLRDVWIKEKNHKPVAALRIVGAVGGVSDLGAMDLDRECESPFFTDYRLVSDYVAGSVQEHEKVAVALRLVLEGHLHRRFPGHIEQGVMLGSVITEIEKASASSPLRHAQRLVDELRVLNNYASPFHHHTGPDRSTRQPVDPGELRAYARRVLDIVHGAEDDSVA